MGFILDGLETESYDRTYSDSQLLKRMIGYFWRHRRAMLLVAITLTLSSITGTAVPILVSRAIDAVANNPRISTMGLLAGGVLLAGAFGWGFNFVRQLISARIGGDVVLSLREDVFNAAIHHDLSFYDEHPSGKIVSRITSDTQDFANIINLVVDAISQVFLLGLLTIWLLTISPGLTGILWAMAPVAVIIALGFRRIARKVTQNSRRITARINALIQESISGITVTKSFRQEHNVYKDFAKNNQQAYRVGLKRGLTFNIIFPILGAASGIGIAILAFTGALRVGEDGISPGSWYLFMQAVGFFWWPLINIASFWSQFQDGLSASERVFALIDADPKVRQTANEAVADIKGRIVFEGLRFTYNEKEDVLNDFSLDIAEGETLALVGHTGSGKSSIARLVARFYEYQEGRLLIDGRDIRSLDLLHYRRHLGFVPQSPFLFSGTVRDNIRYGKPNADDDEVQSAALHIGGGGWLDDFPLGLDTDVGSRGSYLSMGQRQLVALARVFLKNPAIFVLDEATASVDPFTETQIQEGLDAIMAERTAIVIAHRLSTVKKADRIIVIDHGKILEEGSHQGLLAAEGVYADLYNTYFRHQSLDYIESAAFRTAT